MKWRPPGIYIEFALLAALTAWWLLYAIKILLSYFIGS